jgi:PAS domain S-box-containing protein
MKPPLRILHLEDNPRDAELIHGTLESDGILCQITRVETQADFFTALEQRGWDVILADYSLPSFDGLSALKLAVEKSPDVPFIFVSGALGEELAIEALKTGATDYVFKERLSRIVPSVQRALREAEERTKRKQAEEALRESEAKLEEAQRLTHVGYWDRNLDTALITWSDETYRIYGLSLEERITLDRVLELIHPEDREIVLEATSTALRGGRRYNVEYRIFRPDGEVRIVHSQADVTRDEKGRARRMFGTVQDITERKRAEQRLAVQHTVTQTLAEAATLEEAATKILQTVCEGLAWDVGALWRIDPEADVLRCVEIWHHESVEIPEFEATSRETAFPPGMALPGWVWASREPKYIPDLVRDANQQRTPVAAREGLHAAFGSPILLSGEVLGVLEFFSREIRQPDQDLLNMMAIIGSQIGQFIERWRAEEALRHAQMELAHVARVATLGELTASITHEINQPLGAVVNNANAGLRWLSAENLVEARRSLALIIADSHRANEIITRIRALAKKAPPRKDWLDINETIHEVIALARSEVQRNRVALQTQLSDELPLAPGDRIQVQQVILNLINNAIEAMSAADDGPRELEIGSAADQSQHVVVTVRDSGPGLGPEDLTRVFRAFYSTKPQGIGIGLAICRSIINAHGGRLWATINDGRGATFQFTLPTCAEGAA